MAEKSKTSIREGPPMLPPLPPPQAGSALLHLVSASWMLWGLCFMGTLINVKDSPQGVPVNLI